MCRFMIPYIVEDVMLSRSPLVAKVFQGLSRRPPSTMELSYCWEQLARVSQFRGKSKISTQLRWYRLFRKDKLNTCSISQHGQHGKPAAPKLHCPSEFCKFLLVMDFGYPGVRGCCSVRPRVTMLTRGRQPC